MSKAESTEIDRHSFVKGILDAGDALADSIAGWPAQGTKAVGGKIGGKQKVDVRVKEVEVGVGGRESWFARVSEHVEGSGGGQASWEEWEGGLRVNHSQHERDYTPDVYDANEVLVWDQGVLGGLVEEGREDGEGWVEVGMGIYEMYHHIPPPLSDRVFPILLVSARRSTSASFIIVQIPLDLSSFPASIQARRHVKNGRYAGTESGKQGKRLVEGRYVSVERVRKVAVGEGKDGEAGAEKIVWEMATASDAGGALPMAVQKMAIPGKIAKDVPLFLDWVERMRGKVKGEIQSGAEGGGAAV